MIKYRLWDNVDEKMYYSDLPEYPDRVEIMHFTGLLDKNGKEIWESDIVRIGSLYHSSQDEIVFEDGIFKLKMSSDDHEDLSKCCKYLEVVGNIYENSDLLNFYDEEEIESVLKSFKSYIPGQVMFGNTINSIKISKKHKKFYIECDKKTLHFSFDITHSHHEYIFLEDIRKTHKGEYPFNSLFWTLFSEYYNPYDDLKRDEPPYYIVKWHKENGIYNPISCIRVTLIEFLDDFDDSYE